MNPAQSLAWLVAHNWTLAQIAGVARVATTAVRAWQQWHTPIPLTAGVRLMIAALTHQRLLASFEWLAAPDGDHVSNAPARSRHEPAPGAPRITSFAQLCARHCR
jgi:hypothetical protein